MIDKLKQYNINLNNNRFLVLQGEVESISTMKPKSGNYDNPGLLEYLEEIIGTQHFQENIDALQEDYNSLEAKKKEGGEHLKLRQKEIEILEVGKN